MALLGCPLCSEVGHLSIDAAGAARDALGVAVEPLEVCPLCGGRRWLTEDGSDLPWSEVNARRDAIYEATDLTESLARHLATMDAIEQERAVRYLLALLDELGGPDGHVALGGVAHALTDHLSASAALVDW